MSSMVSTVLVAAKSNDLSLLRATLDAWQAQETPRYPRQPMFDFQPALEVALDNHHVEAAEEPILRRCEIDSGIYPCNISMDS